MRKFKVINFFLLSIVLPVGLSAMEGKGKKDLRQELISVCKKGGDLETVKSLVESFESFSEGIWGGRSSSRAKLHDPHYSVSFQKELGIDNKIGFYDRVFTAAVQNGREKIVDYLLNNEKTNKKISRHIKIHLLVYHTNSDIKELLLGKIEYTEKELEFISKITKNKKK